METMREGGADLGGGEWIGSGIVVAFTGGSSGYGEARRNARRHTIQPPHGGRLGGELEAYQFIVTAGVEEAVRKRGISPDAGREDLGAPLRFEG